jgi:hypothetical protein
MGLRRQRRVVERPGLLEGGVGVLEGFVGAAHEPAGLEREDRPPDVVDPPVLDVGRRDLALRFLEQLPIAAGDQEFVGFVLVHEGIIPWRIESHAFAGLRRAKADPSHAGARRGRGGSAFALGSLATA